MRRFLTSEEGAWRRRKPMQSCLGCAAFGKGGFVVDNARNLAARSWCNQPWTLDLHSSFLSSAVERRPRDLNRVVQPRAFTCIQQQQWKCVHTQVNEFGAVNTVHFDRSDRSFSIDRGPPSIQAVLCRHSSDVGVRVCP